MELKASYSIVFLTALVLLSSSSIVNGFDIVKILSRYPNLLAFSDLLNQTNLDEGINKRKTITVLAVDNSSIGGLDGRPLDEIKNILSTHVVLDYFDMTKLKKLPKTSTWTTMYQSSGNADGKQGFVNCTRLPGEQFVFGSAVKDAPPVAKFVKSVFSQPFNISILQVSQPIVAPGLGNEILPPPPPPYTPPPAQPPKASRKSNAKAPADKGEEEEEFAPSESPIEAPTEAPVPAPAPEPVEPPATSPLEPGMEEEAAPAPSSASHMYVGSGVAAAAFIAMALI